MRLLLDTHTFLWWVASSRLSETVKAVVADADNEVYISAVSGWEIAIKARLGKLPLPETPAVFVTQMLTRHGFSVLPITLSHAVHEYHLPTLHNDPFDRLLVAQALENMTLVTDDGFIKQYNVAALW